MLGSEPVARAHHHDPEVARDPAAQLVVALGAAEDRPAAVDPQQRAAGTLESCGLVDEDVLAARYLTVRHLDPVDRPRRAAVEPPGDPEDHPVVDEQRQPQLRRAQIGRDGRQGAGAARDGGRRQRQGAEPSQGCCTLHARLTPVGSRRWHATIAPIDPGGPMVPP
jgi:hypothetical protein